MARRGIVLGAVLAGLWWSGQAWAADEKTLDRTGLIRTFHDEFTSFSWKPDKAHPGVWRSNLGYGGESSKAARTFGHQLQAFTDPNFAGTGSKPLGLNPFSIGQEGLRITATPMTPEQQAAAWGLTYSSGVITSKLSFQQQYGLFEIKARTPRGKGFWSAFWLLPIDNSWPPEIDAFEILGDRPDVVHITLHSHDRGRENEEVPHKLSDSSAAFHTYSVDWQPDFITFYVDDVEVDRRPTPSDMHKPFYMLINLAVGGGWPGSPDQTTRFPSSLDVAWVRVWKRK